MPPGPDPEEVVVDDIRPLGRRGVGMAVDVRGHAGACTPEQAHYLGLQFFGGDHLASPVVEARGCNPHLSMNRHTRTPIRLPLNDGRPIA